MTRESARADLRPKEILAEFMNRRAGRALNEAGHRLLDEAEDGGRIYP